MSTPEKEVEKDKPGESASSSDPLTDSAANSEADANASSDADASASPDADASASSDADASASSDADANANSDADANANSDADNSAKLAEKASSPKPESDKASTGQDSPASENCSDPGSAGILPASNSTEAPTETEATVASKNEEVKWPDVSKPAEKNEAVNELNDHINTANADNTDSAHSDDQEKPIPDNSPPLTQHHVSHLLSEVLQEPQPEPTAAIRKVRIPIVFDVILAIGLLFAVGGFTFGLFHMYLVHSAAQAISEQKYKAAIVILKGAPFPQIFSRPGSDTEEMLSKATYLDAMDRLESENDVAGAIQQLNEIKPGSKYFNLAQEAINENTEPAPMMLQGGTEHNETEPPPQEQKSLVEQTLNEEEK
ncbi:MAG: hypothetical protein K2X77_24180 [Candidatus Obscuribacterales bacterium]|jgi:hypothetical protein|nr:hypothetical protein [Candidatus Obscuribacterales bacterium]